MLSPLRNRFPDPIPIGLQYHPCGRAQPLSLAPPQQPASGFFITQDMQNGNNGNAEFSVLVSCFHATFPSPIRPT